MIFNRLRAFARKFRFAGNAHVLLDGVSSGAARDLARLVCEYALRGEEIAWGGTAWARVTKRFRMALRELLAQAYEAGYRDRDQDLQQQAAQEARLGERP